jgi:hypothetical protein
MPDSPESSTTWPTPAFAFDQPSQKQIEFFFTSDELGLFVEPGLFEPQPPLPGNGFLKAETKSSKGLRRFKNAVAETEFR